MIDTAVIGGKTAAERVADQLIVADAGLFELHADGTVGRYASDYRCTNKVWALRQGSCSCKESDYEETNC
jgi:hypothetical protein